MTRMTDTLSIEDQIENEFRVIEINREEGRVEMQIGGKSVHIACITKESPDPLGKAKSILLNSYLNSTAYI